MKNFNKEDEILKEKIKRGYHVINLNDKVGAGTHWVRVNVKDDVVEYFDSFGLDCP